MEDNIYLRFEDIDNIDYKSSIISLLERRHERVRGVYIPNKKHEFVREIVNIINRYAGCERDFERKLYNMINKDEIKTIYFAIRRSLTEHRPELSDVLEPLSGVEKVMFFVGLGYRKSLDDMYEKDVPEIINDLIKTGYDLIHKRHQIKKHTHKYRRPLKLPGSQKYTKENREIHRAGYDFKKLLDIEKESGSEDDQERTAIFLDSLNPKQLKYLERKFGREAIGGYALVWREDESIFNFREEDLSD